MFLFTSVDNYGAVNKLIPNCQIVKQFMKSKKLILLHHVLLPLLIIPVSYNENFKMGDFLFAIGFLMEASTPFVCLRRILEILGK